MDGILFPQKNAISGDIIFVFLLLSKLSYNSFLPHFFKLTMIYVIRSVNSIKRIYFVSWLLPGERVCFKKKTKPQKHCGSFGFVAYLQSYWGMN